MDFAVTPEPAEPHTHQPKHIPNQPSPPSKQKRERGDSPSRRLDGSRSPALEPLFVLSPASLVSLSDAAFPEGWGFPLGRSEGSSYPRLPWNHPERSERQIVFLKCWSERVGFSGLGVRLPLFLGFFDSLLFSVLSRLWRGGSAPCGQRLS